MRGASTCSLEHEQGDERGGSAYEMKTTALQLHTQIIFSPVTATSKCLLLEAVLGPALFDPRCLSAGSRQTEALNNFLNSGRLLGPDCFCLGLHASHDEGAPRRELGIEQRLTSHALPPGCTDSSSARRALLSSASHRT